MEYKFTMEVKLKGEEINPAPQGPTVPKGPVGPIGMVKIDPKVIGALLPQIMAAVSQPQPKPTGQPQKLTGRPPQQ